jgi:hypothetical protein
MTTSLQAAHRQAVEDEDYHSAFTFSFSQFPLLVPINLNDPNKVRTASDRQGNELWVAFDTVERLQAFYDPAQSFETMTGYALAMRMPPDMRLVMNPGSDFVVEFSPGDIKRVLSMGGAIEFNTARGIENWTEIGWPDEMSRKAEDACKKVLSQYLGSGLI